MTNLINYKSKQLLFGAFIIVVMFVGGLMISAPSASADCTIYTTLRLGSVGADVQCLQSSLAVPVSGIFDVGTKNAVLKFQASHGLVTDGIFGPISRAVWIASYSTIVLPTGCSSSSGYSVTTGLPCSVSVSLPAGCNSTVGYSTLTGARCDISSTLPAGCIPGYLFSVTTGRSCATNTNLPN